MLCKTNGGMQKANIYTLEAAGLKPHSCFDPQYVEPTANFEYACLDALITM